MIIINYGLHHAVKYKINVRSHTNFKLRQLNLWVALPNMITLAPPSIPQKWNTWSSQSSNKLAEEIWFDLIWSIGSIRLLTRSQLIYYFIRLNSSGKLFYKHNTTHLVISQLVNNSHVIMLLLTVDKTFPIACIKISIYYTVIMTTSSTNSPILPCICTSFYEWPKTINFAIVWIKINSRTLIIFFLHNILVQLCVLLYNIFIFNNKMEMRIFIKTCSIWKLKQKKF